MLSRIRAIQRIYSLPGAQGCHCVFQKISFSFTSTGRWFISKGIPYFLIFAPIRLDSVHSVHVKQNTGNPTHLFTTWCPGLSLCISENIILVYIYWSLVHFQGYPV